MHVVLELLGLPLLALLGLSNNGSLSWTKIFKSSGLGSVNRNDICSRGGSKELRRGRMSGRRQLRDVEEEVVSVSIVVLVEGVGGLGKVGGGVVEGVMVMGK